MTVGVEDARAQDVQDLQAAHLAFARQHTPPEDVHALTPDALQAGALQVHGARDADGRLLGIGALQHLEQGHVELKSLHTRADARGRGVGRAVLQHLLGVATASGVARVSLETGSTEPFAPARALYAAAGFVPCAPFGSYPETSRNTFLTLLLPPVEQCGRP